MKLSNRKVSAPSENGESVTFSVIIIIILLLSSFTLPGRTGASGLEGFDIFSLFKAVFRIITLVLLLLFLSKQLRNPRFNTVFRNLLPFYFLSFWAIFSTYWSAITFYTLGHAVELLILVLFSTVVGMQCTDEKKLSSLLATIVIGYLVINILSITLALIVFKDNVLIRSQINTITEIRFINYNVSMATLGYVALIYSKTIWNWKWSRIVFFPAAIIDLYTIYLSQSRLNLSIVVFTTLFLLFIKKTISLAFFILFLIIFLVIIISTRIDFNLNSPKSDVINYLKRGQTQDELYSISGRTPLWEKIWDSFLESPIIGHGYLSVSPTGKIKIWGEEQLITAHNLILQSLVSLGIIGFFLLIWSISKVIVQLLKSISKSGREIRLEIFLIIVFVIFIYKSIIGISILGAIRPHHVLFYLSAGISSGILLKKD